jgi:helix-turn-helix protein/glycosyl hydrolase family 42 (putative beta-galactosidase)
MAGASRNLSDVLEDLKARSGLSYESIGRKVHASKSTVHRYCTGLSLPHEFGVVERIGLACNATRAEMLLLHRLWVRATAPDNVETPVAAVARPDTLTPRPTRWRSSVSLVAVCLVVALTSAGTPPARSTMPMFAQWVSGPAWTLPAAQVPSTTFGVTINSATGAMPGFHVGAVRLWDDGTRWSEIQPQPGEFDWSVLDRLVGGAEHAGLPVLFVFGGTPRWAAPTGPADPYPDGSSSAPPDSIADWDAYVQAVVQRYRGRISSYELWVLANDKRFYSGSMETLVDMTRRASAIVRAADPKATVVCPGMGQLWTQDGVRMLKRFAELGGYGYCDVAGVKLFQQSAADPPETMLELTTTIDRVMHEAGIHPRLWNTGTTYSIPLQGSLDETKAIDYAVRFFLVGLYARNVNLERMYFYNWGGTKIPIVLQAVGGTPTRAALAVEQMQRWLTHAQSRSCGHGSALNLPGNVWECDFTITQADRTYDAAIRWTDTGIATTTAEPGTRSVHRLDGTTTPAKAGDTITVTEEPILVEYR